MILTPLVDNHKNVAISNIKHSETQVLCKQWHKAFFSLYDNVDTKNTMPNHVCLKGLIHAVSTQIGNFVV